MKRNEKKFQTYLINLVFFSEWFLIQKSLKLNIVFKFFCQIHDFSFIYARRNPKKNKKQKLFQISFARIINTLFEMKQQH